MAPPPPAATPAAVEDPAATPAVASEPVSDGASVASEQPAASGPAANPAAASQQSPDWRNPWLLVVLIVLGLVAWQWFEPRQKMADTQQELARRLADSDSSGAEVRALSKGRAIRWLASSGASLRLRRRLANRRASRRCSRSYTRMWLAAGMMLALAEVEQSLTLAAQQLQLAGNVQAAVPRPAKCRNPVGGKQPTTVRQSAPGFEQRSRTSARLPQIDVAAMSLRLESVINALDTIPLAVDGRSPAHGDDAKRCRAGRPSASCLPNGLR
ncbi:hypothetical protein [Candidatus Accumulibacter sp. ACC012]|uniref:hypothetical protein n=1 Tax=Candidatus Accumulibacter sp. ACC012 TaxID=2823332 RepID=UPI0025C72429|nr:hypothetical protein [Candidatus Accumulibacter sp. ACC012]